MAFYKTALISCLLILCSCGNSPEYIRKSLEKKASEDLADIIEELKLSDKAHLVSNNPSYEVEEFEVFTADTARVFGAYAMVEFYYFKNLKLKQVRKYRFRSVGSLWDRYSVELKHIYKDSSKDSVDIKNGN